MKYNTIFKTLLAVLLLAAGQGSSWAQTFTVTSTYNSGNHTTTFKIKRTGDYLPQQTIYYRTVSLTAFEGAHFQPVHDSYTFGEGDTLKTVTVIEAASVSGAYNFQNGTTRSYRFEVLDVNGFYLAHNVRSMNIGTSVPSSGAFNIKDVTIESSAYLVTDAGYLNNGCKYALSSNYFNNAAPKAYFQAIGAQLRMMLSFDAKEVDDGYQYLQILFDNTTSCDSRPGNSLDPQNGHPGTPNLSRYTAGFEMNTGSTDGTYRKYSFPDTSVYSNAGASNPWGYGTAYPLSKQLFKSTFRASDGRLIVPTAFDTIVVRLNASGQGDDDWYAKNVKAHIQAVDETNPTLISLSAITVSPGPYIVGDTFYISVPFSEIVHISGALKQLYTTWGTVEYFMGDYTNVITYKGTINASAGTTLAITEVNNSLFNDLAGNFYQGNDATCFDKTFTGVTCSATYTLDNYNTVFSALDGNYWVSDGTVLPQPHPTVNFYKGTKTDAHRTTLTETTHYTLAWSNNTAAGNGTVTATGTGSYTGSASTTFPIRWSNYTVRFHSNGSIAIPATGTMSDQSFQYGVAQNLTANAFSREGFTFIGWDTAPDGSGTAYTDGQSVSELTPTDGAVIDLYAQWAVIPWTGTGDNAGDSYIILYASQLDSLAATVNSGNSYSGKYFKLNANITYGSEGLGNTENNYTAIGNGSNPFSGTFNGQGHTVSGLRIKKDPTTSHYRGLFGKLSNGTVQNVIIDNSVFSGFSYIGGIAGYANNSTISGCLVTNTSVVGTATNHIGIIVCDTNTVTLSANYYRNCTGNGNSTGGVWNGDVDGARSVHPLTLPDDVTASGESIVIDAVTYYASNTTVTLTYSGDPGYTVSYSYNDGSDHAISGHTFTMPASDAVTVSRTLTDRWGVTSGHDGNSEATAYLISDTTGLNLLARYVNGTDGYTANVFVGKFFKLANNITYSHEDLGATESNYTAIGGYFNGSNRYFWGTFDGDNDTISGIRIYKGGTTNADSYQGLFGLVYGTIKNVTLTDAVITGKQHVGGIVGYISMNAGVGGNIENCHVTGSVTLHAVANNAHFHGGLVGIFDGDTLSGCTSAATLTVADGLTHCTEYGGLVGELTGNLLNCLVVGATVSGTDMVGAVAGNKYDGYTFTANYYRGCTVSGTANATGVGVGSESDNNTPNDIAGIRSLHTLTLGDGITATGASEPKVIGDTTYYAALSTVTLSYTGTPATGYLFDSISVDTGTLSGSTLTFTPAADVTATAVFAPIAYNITYDLAGGSASNPATYNIETPTFTLVNPTREGYTFAGWTGTGLADTTATVTIAQGSTGERSYTATWTPITYNITYNLAGGSVASANPATYNIETPTFTLANPAAPIGYTFAGWTGTGLDAATTTVTVAQGSTGDRSYTATWTDVWGIAGGANGTEEHPYIITNTAGLDLLATLVNGGNYFIGNFFKLGADITYTHTTDWNDATSTESNYTAIGGRINNQNKYFRGTFDGQGHTVSGIRIYKGGNTDADKYQGLFGHIGEYGMVKNVTLADSRITSKGYTGGIAGNTDHSSVENCHVAATVALYANVISAQDFGGIVGNHSGTVSGCTSAATVSNNGKSSCSDYGGIVGINTSYSTIENCLALGAKVSANSNCGPVVGYNSILGTVITNCHYRNCNVNNVSQNDIYTVSGVTDVTVAPSGDATTTYPYGGIEVYSYGLYYGGTLYAIDNASLTLGYTGSDEHIGFKASNGTISGYANPYSLTLEGADVVVNNATCADDTIGPAFTIRPFNDTTLCVDPDGNYVNTVNRIAALVSPADLRDNYSATNAITVTSSINFAPKEDQNDGYETDTDPREVTYGKRTYSQVWTATDACGNTTREKLYIHLYPLATIRIDSLGAQTITYGEDIRDVLIHHQYSNLALDAPNSGVSLYLSPGDDTTGTLRGMPDSAGIFNYTLTATSWHDCNSVDTTVTITVNPRPITITAASATKKYDGTPLTSNNYICTLTAPFSDINNRILVNNDSIASVTLTGSQTAVGSSAVTPSNAVITIATEPTADKNPSYAITYVPGTLTVIENDTLITVTAGSGSKVYDGTPLTMTAHGDFTVTGLPAGLTWTATADGTLTNVTPGVGEKAVNAVTSFHIFDANSVDVTSYFTNKHYVSGTLSITPKPITITAASDTKEYDGTALTNSNYTYTSSDLVTGETITSVTVTGSQTQAGSSDNVPSAAVIMNYNFNFNVNDNYNITYLNGTLTVTQKPLTITAGSDTIVYNGAWLYNNTYTHSALATGDSIWSVTIKDSALYGESPNVPRDAVIKNAAGDTITNSYNINYVIGHLKIKQKELFITSGSASKVYDGTELTCHTYTYSGLVACDTIETVAWWSSLKNADTIDNVFSLTEIHNTIINDTDVTNCYIIEPDYGKLMVTKKPLTITGGSASKPYDGTPLTCDSFTHTELVAGDSIWSVSLVDSLTVVGSRDNVPCCAEIQNSTPDHVTDNYDITYVPGTLTVTPGIFVGAGGWQAISAPVHDEGVTYWTPAAALTTGAYDLFRYDEPTATWQNYKSSTFALDRGRGYLYRRTDDLAIPFGGNYHSGDVSVALTAGGSGDLQGFNLVGNPYPYSVTLCMPFYSLDANGSWRAHAAGDTVAVGQGVLVYTDHPTTLIFHDEQGCPNDGGKNYLPPLPKGLCLGDCDDSNNDVITQSSNHPFAYWDGDHLVITSEGLLTAYDIMGRQLFSHEVNSELRLPNSDFPATGVYILKLNGQSQKIVIKKLE